MSADIRQVGTGLAQGLGQMQQGMSEGFGQMSADIRQVGGIGAQMFLLHSF